MSVLERVYMSGGDMILSVVELWSSAWPDRLVLAPDYVPHEITTEDDRQLTALPCAMAVATPKRDASGGQTLTVLFDGVRGDATALARAASEARALTFLTVREYLLSDLSEPAATPITMVVNGFKAAADQIEIRAGLFDLIDMRWPRLLYNSETAPCLKFMQR